MADVVASAMIAKLRCMVPTFGGGGTKPMPLVEEQVEALDALADKLRTEKIREEGYMRMLEDQLLRAKARQRQAELAADIAKRKRRLARLNIDLQNVETQRNNLNDTHGSKEITDALQKTNATLQALTSDEDAEAAVEAIEDAKKINGDIRQRDESAQPIDDSSADMKDEDVQDMIARLREERGIEAPEDPAAATLRSVLPAVASDDPVAAQPAAPQQQQQRRTAIPEAGLAASQATQKVRRQAAPASRAYAVPASRTSAVDAEYSKMLEEMNG